MQNIISLGMSCQSAHQIARFVQQSATPITHVKGPFDWLICPPRAASSWLDNKLEAFNPAEIVEDRGHAYWPKHAFWFWHSFYSRQNTTRSLDIIENMQREQEKLAYQTAKFADLEPNKTIFIFSNTQNNLATDVFHSDETSKFCLSLDAVHNLRAALENYWGGPIDLHFISRSDRCDNGVSALPNVHLMDSEPSEWKGSDALWDTILTAILSSERPAA